MATDELSQKPVLLYCTEVSLFCLRHEAIAACLIPKPACLQISADGRQEARREQPNVKCHFICQVWLAGGTPFGSHCLQAQGCDTKKEQKFVHICSSAGPVQGEGKSLTVTFQGACQVAVLMPTALCRDLCLKQTCSQIEGEQRA